MGPDPRAGCSIESCLGHADDTGAGEECGSANVRLYGVGAAGMNARAVALVSALLYLGLVWL